MQERDYAREYGNRCRQIRQAKGLSQQDVADKMHTTPQNVSKWEKEGISNVNTVMRLSEVLGQDITADQIDQEGTVGEIGKEILMFLVDKKGKTSFGYLVSNLFGMSESRVMTELFKLERIGNVIREQFEDFNNQPIDMVYITAKGIITIKNLQPFGLATLNLKDVESYEDRIGYCASMQEKTESDRISKLLWNMKNDTLYRLDYVWYLKKNFRAELPDGYLIGEPDDYDRELILPEDFLLGHNCFVDLMYRMATDLTRERISVFRLEMQDVYDLEMESVKFAYEKWGGDYVVKMAQSKLAELLPFVKAFDYDMYIRTLEEGDSPESQKICGILECTEGHELDGEVDDVFFESNVPEDRRDNCLKWFTKEQVEKFVKELYCPARSEKEKEIDRAIQEINEINPYTLEYFYSFPEQWEENGLAKMIRKINNIPEKQESNEK